MVVVNICHAFLHGNRTKESKSQSRPQPPLTVNDPSIHFCGNVFNDGLLNFSVPLQQGVQEGLQWCHGHIE